MRALLAATAALTIAITTGGSAATLALPAGDVAVAASHPITVTQYDHWMHVAVDGNSAQSPAKTPAIVPLQPPRFASCIAEARHQLHALRHAPTATVRRDCASLFESLNGQVLDFLIKAYWYEAQAAQLGIVVSPAQQQQLLAAQERQFPTHRAFLRYVRKLGMTPADVRFRILVNKLFADLLARATPAITSQTIAAYYAAHRSEFITPPARSLDLLLTRTRGEALAALAALRSGRSWQSVAKTYSIASRSTKSSYRHVPRGELPRALNKAVFSARVGQLGGPVTDGSQSAIFKVTQIVPVGLQTLKQASPLITELLQLAAGETATTDVNRAAAAAWQSSTVCQTLYQMQDCAPRYP